MKKVCALLERIAVAVEALVDIKHAENVYDYETVRRGRAEQVLGDVARRHGGGFLAGGTSTAVR